MEKANKDGNWVELDDPVDRTRLLYGCPVCFLTTVQEENTSISAANDGTTSISASSSNAKASVESAKPQPQPPKHNVMVISWLMPVTDKHDNSGGLILLSMNRRRHTASVLLNNSPHNKSFGLSIPTSSSSSSTVDGDMEEVLKNVGRTSGGWGRSKFPCDHQDVEEFTASSADTAINDDTTDRNNKAGSKNKKNKQARIEERLANNKKNKHARKQERFPRGIPHLRRTGLGRHYCITVSTGQQQKDNNNTDNSDDRNVFAIDGTVAHLQCQVLRMEEAPLIDDEHYLIVAKITRAFVQESYWNKNDTSKERIFFGAPSPNANTIGYPLTFFGSARFGHVRTELNNIRDEMITTPLPGTIINPTVSTTPWTVVTADKQYSRLLYTNPLCLMSCATKHDTRQQKSFVISRLTATNNFGKFMFCIDRLAVADMLLSVNEEPFDIIGKKFNLSVPVQGMQCLLQQLMEPKGENHDQPAAETVSWTTIPVTTPLEATSAAGVSNTGKHPVQYITGCVALMECQVYDTTTTATTIDTTDVTDVVVVLAKVDRAFVHPSYWKKNQQWFVPSDDGGDKGLAVPPYMKQLGNQTFGYVMPSI